MTRPPPADSPGPLVPVVSLCGVALTTGAALALLPVNPFPPGAIQTSALVQTAGLLIGPALTAVRAPRRLMQVECLIMVGLVYWVLLDVVQGRYGLAETSAESVSGAIGAIGLFAAGVWAAQLLPALPLPGLVARAARIDLSPPLLLAATVCSFGLGMFHYLYSSDFDLVVMADGLTRPRFDTPWMRFRMAGQYTGSWLVFGEQLGNFGLLLAPLAAMTGRRKGYLHAQTVFTAVLAAVYLAFILHSGNRRILGMSLGAALLAHVLTSERLRMREVVALLVGLLALLLVLELTIAARDTGRGLSSLGEGDVQAFRQGLVRVDDNFLRLAQVVSLFPDQYDYLYGERVWFTVTRPIPRVFWPGKPVDPGFDLPRALGLYGMSLSASVVADMYMAGGLAAVALGGFGYGLMAACWNRVLVRRPTTGGVILYALGLMAIFNGLRNVDELVFTSYPLLAWLALTTAIFTLTGRAGRPA